MQVSTLPDNISYSTLTITISGVRQNAVQIPRRELYDVRMQLMAEDEDLPDNPSLSTLTPSGVPSSVACEGRKKEREVMLDFVNGHEDVRAGIYEGGLKSWECSIDLVRWLARQLKEKGEGGEEGLSIAQGFPRILELGCGTSLPSLFLFQEAVKMRHSATGQEECGVNGGGGGGEGKGGITFHLADYNYEVLRLVTMPNIFLSWVLCTRPGALAAGAGHPNGDISVTEDLKAAFLTSLSRDHMNIQLGFISGCWGDEMLSLLLQKKNTSYYNSNSNNNNKNNNYYNMVLGSETIYEPRTAGEFTKVLVGCLGDGSGTGGGGGVGLVAAKQMYFGVGGSIEAFARGIRDRGGGWLVREVDHIGREGGGVGGVIVEVKKDPRWGAVQ